MLCVGIQTWRKQYVTLITVLPPLQLKWTIQKVVILLTQNEREREQLIHSLIQTTHRGVLPFNRDFMDVYAASLCCFFCMPATTAALQLGFFFSICIHTLMNKQTSHLYRVQTCNTVATTSTDHQAQSHTRLRRLKHWVFLLQISQPIRILGAQSLMLT